jgi:hypothetical protein
MAEVRLTESTDHLLQRQTRQNANDLIQEKGKWSFDKSYSFEEAT